LALKPAGPYSVPKDVAIELFRTTDAGLTWLPTVGGAGAFQTVTSIALRTPPPPSPLAPGFVLRSSDGGATWSTLTAADPQSPDATAVAFATPTLGYELVATGIIRRTSDGGKPGTHPSLLFPARSRPLILRMPRTG